MAWFRGILRSPAGRTTNQTLLVALVLVFGTGVATVAIGWWIRSRPSIPIAGG